MYHIKSIPQMLALTMHLYCKMAHPDIAPHRSLYKSYYKYLLYNRAPPITFTNNTNANYVL